MESIILRRQEQLERQEQQQKKPDIGLNEKQTLPDEDESEITLFQDKTMADDGFEQARDHIAKSSSRNDEEVKSQGGISALSGENLINRSV
jgi:hypothetical protein